MTPTTPDTPSTHLERAAIDCLTPAPAAARNALEFDVQRLNGPALPMPNRPLAERLGSCAGHRSPLHDFA